MNSIFKNDCELIKTISNKKVYPNCKPEVIEIVKKSTIQPFESKENIVFPVTKAEKIDTVTSPKAFHEVSNRIVWSSFYFINIYPSYSFVPKAAVLRKKLWDKFMSALTKIIIVFMHYINLAYAYCKYAFLADAKQS